MVSIIPINDDKEHDLSICCWCEPEVEWSDGIDIYPNGPIVRHSALDGRVVVEDLTGESLEESKKWALVET